MLGMYQWVSLPAPNEKPWPKQPYWYLNLLYVQSVPQSGKKLVCLEYCVSELIMLLTLDAFFSCSPILLKLSITKLQINLSAQQKKNEKHLWKSVKKPSLAFAIACYSNGCWLGREREMCQDKVTRETSSKKERFAVCRLDWLIWPEK